jgi:Zn finger protein HypA/HybF involved in hydrogenase expression
MIVEIECPRCEHEFEVELLTKPLSCPNCSLKVLYWDEMFEDAIPSPVFENIVK